MALELLATAVVNGADNLWRHYKSIDYPVDRYCIVDNSEGLFSDVTEVINKICQDNNQYINEPVVVLKNNFNTGFAGAVNQIIKQNIDCNYWFITNDDWHIAPGNLKKLDKRLKDYFFGLLCDPTELNGYSAFVMSNDMVSKVGLMDENFYPAYCEDNDHRYRMKQAGFTWENFPLVASHNVSSTLNSSKTFKEKNNVTFSSNVAYYIEKWGGDRGQERYITPYNSGAPLDYWRFNPDRIYNNAWF